MKGLIAYGTRYGSTTDIANKMGDILAEAGINTRIVNLSKEQVIGISSYDLVIVGSAIRFGNWTKETLRFLERFESELSRKKVALFVSCGDARDPKKHEEAKKNYLKKVAEKYPSIRPCKLGLFGRVIDLKKYGFGIRQMMKALTKDLKMQGIDTSKPYDFRNWEAIQNWTKELLDQCADNPVKCSIEQRDING
ncbi:MAG: flavodoxin domain-containing protein [Candidatus Methanofastidiosia archaeon]